VRQFISILATVVWSGTIAFSSIFVCPDPRSPLQRLDIPAIEKTLWEWVNKERADRKLRPLKLLPDLTKIAGGHSRDMASRRMLTHLSSTKKTYLDRLVDAGMYFVEIGENVAASDSFDAAFIHQGLMESPEHRANILNPNFDAIGIAAVYSNDNKYYITQDFIQTLEIRDVEDAAKFFQVELNKIRKEHVLHPLAFQKVVDNFAQKHAEKKATGKPLFNIANFFGETHIHFITTPELTIPGDISQTIASAIYESGGVGVWFGRLPDYPGGTYLVTFFLFPMSQYKDLTEKDLTKIVLDAINVKRREAGLASLRLDERLSKDASAISDRLKTQRVQSAILPARPMQHQVLSYVTENPRVWPTNLDSEITDPSLRRIGIGASSQKNKETRRHTFWITLIL
jgi:uncharacterized protein YkwD